MKPHFAKQYSLVEATKFTLSLVLSQSTVLLSPFIVQASGLSEYGRIEVALALASLLSIILSLGLHQLVGLRYIKNHGALAPIVETTLIYLICVFVISSLFVAGLYQYLLPLIDSSSPVDLFIIFLFSSLLYFKNLTLSIAAMSHRANLYLMIETLSALAYVSVVATSLYFHELNLVTVMVANVASVIPSLAIVVVFASRNMSKIKYEVFFF